MPIALPITVPLHAALPLGIAALAPLLLMAVIVPLARRRARGIATVLALRTTVLLSVGFVTLATVATLAVIRTGLSELQQRHLSDTRALADALASSRLGPLVGDAELRLALYRARDASVGFVAVGVGGCTTACIVSANAADFDVGALRGHLAAVWPTSEREQHTVTMGDKLYLLVASPVPGNGTAASAMVVAGIDASYLATQATLTAWVLVAISYALLFIVGWSSREQARSSLTTRISAITHQLQTGSVEQRKDLRQDLKVDGDELRELANSVSSYIERTLEEQKSSDERYRRLVELAPDGVFMCSLMGIKFANAAALALAGVRSRTDLFGQPISKFLEFEELTRTGAAGSGMRPAKWRRPDGTVLHVEVAEIADNSRDANSASTTQYLVRDVTHRRQREADLAHRAEHDALTGLANRARFEARVTELLKPGPANRAGDDSRQVAVLFIDLDGFKPVNDRHGHAAGDAVLVAVADRLRDSTRGSDVIARFGGDEFAVVLEVRDPEEVDIVAGRILSALQQPIDVKGVELRIGASIGVAHAHPDAEGGNRPRSTDELLRAADAAMYVAKSEGGTRYTAAA